MENREIANEEEFIKTFKFLYKIEWDANASQKMKEVHFSSSSNEPLIKGRDINGNETGVPISFAKMRRKIKKNAIKEVTDYIITNYFINEDVLRKYLPYFDWSTICEKQILSESFIEEFENEVDWLLIFFYQSSISGQFIEKHKKKIQESPLFKEATEEEADPNPGNEILANYGIDVSGIERVLRERQNQLENDIQEHIENVSGGFNFDIDINQRHFELNNNERRREQQEEEMGGNDQSIVESFKEIKNIHSRENNGDE